MLHSSLSSYLRLCNVLEAHLLCFAGSGRSFRAYVFRKDNAGQLSASKAEGVHSECKARPELLLKGAEDKYAALLDLQLRRIHISSRPSDSVPRLSVAKGAARIPDNARSARRAARANSIPVSARISSDVSVKVRKSLSPCERSRMLNKEVLQLTSD
jgi:hypothetical protein